MTLKPASLIKILMTFCLLINLVQTYTCPSQTLPTDFTHEQSFDASVVFEPGVYKLHYAPNTGNMYMYGEVKDSGNKRAFVRKMDKFYQDTFFQFYPDFGAAWQAFDVSSDEAFFAFVSRGDPLGLHVLNADGSLHASQMASGGLEAKRFANELSISQDGTVIYFSAIASSSTFDGYLCKYGVSASTHFDCLELSGAKMPLSLKEIGSHNILVSTLTSDLAKAEIRRMDCTGTPCSTSWATQYSRGGNFLTYVTVNDAQYTDFSQNISYFLLNRAPMIMVQLETDTGNHIYSHAIDTHAFNILPYSLFGQGDAIYFNYYESPYILFAILNTTSNTIVFHKFDGGSVNPREIITHDGRLYICGVDNSTSEGFFVHTEIENFESLTTSVFTVAPYSVVYTAGTVTHSIVVPLSDASSPVAHSSSTLTIQSITVQYSVFTNPDIVENTSQESFINLGKNAGNLTFGIDQTCSNSGISDIKYEFVVLTSPSGLTETIGSDFITQGFVTYFPETAEIVVDTNHTSIQIDYTYEFIVNRIFGNMDSGKVIEVQVVSCDVANCAVCQVDRSKCQQCVSGFSLSSSQEACEENVSSTEDGNINRESEAGEAEFVAMGAVGCSAAFATIAALLSSSSSNGVWSSVNLFQLLLYVPLIGAFLHADVEQFISGLDFLNFSFAFIDFDSIPYLNKLLLLFPKTKNSPKMIEIGIEFLSTYRNCFGSFLILSSIVALHLVLILPLYIKAREYGINSQFKSCMNKVTGFFCFAIYIRILLEITVMSSLSTAKELKTEINESVLIACVLLCFTVLYCVAYYKQIDLTLDPLDFERRPCDEFFSGLKHNKWASLYHGTFISRRLLSTAIVILLSATPLMVKIISMVVLHSAVLIYMLLVRPFSCPKDNIVETINDISFATILTVLIKYNTEEAWSDSVALIVIFFLVFMTFITALVQAAHLTKILIQIWKDYLQNKRKKRVQPTAPQIPVYNYNNGRVSMIRKSAVKVTPDQSGIALNRRERGQSMYTDVTASSHQIAMNQDLQGRTKKTKDVTHYAGGMGKGAKRRNDLSTNVF